MRIFKKTANKWMFPSALLPVLGFALVAAAPLARGQDSDSPPPSHWHHRGPTMMLDRILSHVSGLTSAQHHQIHEIEKSARKQGKAIRENDGLSEDDRRQQMMALAKSTMEQVRGVLTPDQQTQFDAAREQMMQRWKEHRHDQGNGTPPPPPPPPPPPSQG